MKPIDGTEFKKHIESALCYGCEIGHVVTPCGRCHVSDLLRYIDEIPEVDAQPVKRGKWISEKVQKKDWKGIERSYFQPNSCSVCHIGVAVRTKFCPNCGAKMCVGDTDET